MRFYLILTASCCLAVAGALTLGRLMNEERDKVQAAWEAQMLAAGCKVTGFAGRQPLPVWTCPDGTAHLGY